jgi:hypothetical protein
MSANTGAQPVKNLIAACAFCCAILPTVTSAQTQPQPAQPPAKPPQGQPPQGQPPQPRGTSGSTASRAVTLAIEVTDRSGNPVGDVQVALAGPVERSGETTTDGTVAFRSLRSGTYRLRFEHGGFATFEREVVIGRGQKAAVSVALTPAAETPQPEPAEPEPPAVPEPSTPTVVAEPRTMSLLDFLDKNMVRSSEPFKTSVLGCAQGGTARLMQVREPLDEQSHADLDELIYVIAGEGTLSLNGTSTKVTAGHFAMVPRGTEHVVTRQGRNPLIFVSVLAGSPCTEPVR